MRAFALPLLVLLSLLAGCAGQPVNKQSSFSADQYDLTSFEGFSEALEASMESKDTALFADHFDAHSFASRSLHSLGLGAVKQQTVDAYAEVMDKAMKNRFQQTFSEIDSVRFVRMLPDRADRADQSVALMRISPQSGGINYWEVYLQRSNGQVSIVDWFSYSLGDLASSSLGRFILQVGLAKLKPDSKSAGLINAYLAAAKSGDPEKLVNAYDRLPKNIRTNSLLMLSQVQNSKQISDDAYKATLEKLAPLYHENDNYALMLVDYYLYTEDYPKAHKALDTISRKIGGDAGLDSLHAGIDLADGNYKRAIAFARDGIRKESAYEDNYWVLLDALVYSRNYSDAVLVLNILEEGFGYQFDMQKLATLDGYQDFARSSEFKGWRTASSY